MTKSSARNTLKLPRKLLAPIGVFLSDQLKTLKRRRKTVDEADPFKGVARSAEHASPDTGAEEQFGHARAAAVRGQLDRKIVQTRRALAMVRIGSYGNCEDCGNLIDTDRLMIYPEATACVSCEVKREKNR